MRGCVLLLLPAATETAAKWKSAALRTAAARRVQRAGEPHKLLSGSKEDAEYILANIKNSLSRDNGGGKSAERTSLVNARSKNIESLSEDLILIFAAKI